MLRWGHRYGKDGVVDVHFFNDIWDETGKKPAALRDRPTLPEHLSPYVKAFFKLSRRRSEGKPIPMAEIAAFLSVSPGIDPEFFLAVVDDMDDAYFNWQVERAADDRTDRD